MKIVFMGTPEFAVASLDAIVNSKHEVLAVVTTPDKPAGRGMKIHSSPVKQYALSHHIPLFQPVKLKDPEFITSLEALKADVFVVVAFRMLPEEVYSIPEKGAFNVHASLLPNYRGAAPIHRAVMNGEKKTGATTFFLNKEIDKGDILEQVEIEIGEEETTGELYERLKMIGAQLAVSTLDKIEIDDVKPFPQILFNEKDLKIANKIHKEDMLIDWRRPAKEIVNQIKGLAPFPGAYTKLQTISGVLHTLKCFKASVTPISSDDEPGVFLIKDKNSLIVNALDLQISLENVQFQGKSAMQITDFLQGFRCNNFINRMVL